MKGTATTVKHVIWQKLRKESYKFNSGFRDGGYIILVEKLNKQGNSQSTSHPQHHPSLNCCTFSQSFYTIDTQDKIKAMYSRNGEEKTLVYIQMHLPAISMCKSLQTCVENWGDKWHSNLARNYSVSGGPWAIVNDRTTQWLVLLQGVNSACSLAIHV